MAFFQLINGDHNQLSSLKDLVSFLKIKNIME